jgi:hypothetical protein
MIRLLLLPFWFCNPKVAIPRRRHGVLLGRRTDFWKLFAPGWKVSNKVCTLAHDVYGVHDFVFATVQVKWHLATDL